MTTKNNEAMPPIQTAATTIVEAKAVTVMHPSSCHLLAFRFCVLYAKYTKTPTKSTAQKDQANPNCTACHGSMCSLKIAQLSRKMLSTIGNMHATSALFSKSAKLHSLRG